ncbi:hypothetical protein [Paenibacillus sp. YIM B09110]|uniref:hypothetical protein n=1 Tax=Paenibacillus sp. YIM B09110 TaxID=3126102 RepID=UPI00301C44D8
MENKKTPSSYWDEERLLAVPPNLTEAATSAVFDPLGSAVTGGPVNLGRTPLRDTLDENASELESLHRHDPNV